MKYEDFQKHHKEGICPICNSHNVRYYDDYSTGEGYICEGVCKNCGGSFNECYELKFIGHSDIKTWEERK